MSDALEAWLSVRLVELRRAVALLLDEDRGEAGCHQQRRGDEAEKLAITGAEHPPEGIRHPGVCAPLGPLRLLASASSAEARATSGLMSCHVPIAHE